MRDIASPSFLMQQRQSNAIASLRRQIETAQTEVSTGRLANPGPRLGAAVADAGLLARYLTLAASYTQSIDRFSVRAEIMQTSLDAAMRAAAIGPFALSASLRGDEASLTTLAAEARASVGTLFAAFNQRIEGRTLFSGDAADQPSLGDPAQMIADIEALAQGAATAADLDAALDLYFNDAGGGFATTVYRGGNGFAPRAEIAPGEIVGVEFRADAPTLRDLFRGLAGIIAAATLGPGEVRSGALASAAASLQSSADGLALAQAAIGVAQERAATARVGAAEREATVTKRLNELTAVDAFEAASRLLQIESQLDATLAITARLSRLSLASYI